MNKAIVDGDIVAYWAAGKLAARYYEVAGTKVKPGYEDGKNGKVRAQELADILGGEVEYKEDPVDREDLANLIWSTFDKLFVYHEVTVCVSSSPCWRTKLYPEYKAGRPPRSENVKLAFEVLKDVVEDQGLEWEEREGFEADDLISILHRKCVEDGDTPVVVSVDKDLRQLPGQHVISLLNMDEITITEDEARHNLWLQVLIGDSVDNIKGCPGIGKKKGAKIIHNAEMEHVYEFSFESPPRHGPIPSEEDFMAYHVHRAYNAAGQGVEDMAKTYTLVKLLKDEDRGGPLDVVIGLSSACLRVSKYMGEYDS